MNTFLVILGNLAGNTSAWLTYKAPHYLAFTLSLALLPQSDNKGTLGTMISFVFLKHHSGCSM